MVCLLATTAIVVHREFAERSTSSGQPARVNRAVNEWPSLVASGHRSGSSSPLLTIVEFGDFECPACRQWFPVIEAFRKAHSSNVAFVFHHWPLSYHRFAYPAARASECAGEQTKFWEYYQLLYAGQDSLGLITFHELAKRAAVPDLSRFDVCNGSASRVPAIDQDVDAARQIKAWGTPSIIINGVLQVGMPDAAKLESTLATAERTASRT